MADSDDDQLERTNSSIADWEQKRDADAIARLDEVLSPDLVFRRANKTVVGKQEFMAGLSEPSPFASRESEDATVEIRGDRALVTLTVATTKEDGTESRYRTIRMFIRRDERWRVEFWFNDDVTHVTGL
jgi:ketosteroid isomerase-like protein